MTRVLPGLPDKAEDTTELKVRRISFGEEYEQVRKAGLNNKLRTWKLTYNQQRKDIINMVRDFLVSTDGVEAFYFTPPGDAAPALVRVDGSFSRSFPHQDAAIDFSFGLREVVA